MDSYPHSRIVFIFPAASVIIWLILIILNPWETPGLVQPGTGKVAVSGRSTTSSARPENMSLRELWKHREANEAREMELLRKSGKLKYEKYDAVVEAKLTGFTIKGIETEYGFMPMCTSSGGVPIMKVLKVLHGLCNVSEIVVNRGYFQIIYWGQNLKGKEYTLYLIKEPDAISGYVVKILDPPIPFFKTYVPVPLLDLSVKDVNRFNAWYETDGKKMIERGELENPEEKFSHRGRDESWESLLKAWRKSR